jgi:hypothetical protein
MFYWFEENEMSCDDEQILRLDNDHIYAFLTTGLIRTTSDNNIIKIQERKMISHDICIGGYGFQNNKTCLHYLNDVMETTEDEPFLSYMYSIR